MTATLAPEKFDAVQEALKDVMDPELGINVVDLGLIYDLSWDEENDALVIHMTLTSAGCPLTDVLEAMVGELPSDASSHDPDVVRREDGSWLLDGALSIERFRDLFPMECDELEGSRDFQTLAGLVLFELGSIPGTGQVMNWQGLRMSCVSCYTSYLTFRPRKARATRRVPV